MEKNFVLFMLFPHLLESDQHTVVINKCVNCLSLINIIIYLAPYSFLSFKNMHEGLRWWRSG